MVVTLPEQNIYCDYDFTDRPDWWGPTFEEIMYKLPMLLPTDINDFIFKTGIPIGTGKTHFLLKFADHYLTRRKNGTIISALDDYIFYVGICRNAIENIKDVSKQIINSNNLDKIKFFKQMENFHGFRFENKLFLLDGLKDPKKFIYEVSRRSVNCLFISLEN